MRAPPANAGANAGPEANHATDDGGEPEPEPKPANSAREIDIWLSNLAIATRSGNRRGVALQHDMLRKARPDKLVDERVRNALDNEDNALVRIQYWLAFHDDTARHDWAVHVYDTRTARFMGTDDQYGGGEIEELKLITRELYASLVGTWQADEIGDTRLMALVRNVLTEEKPDWLLAETTANVLTPIVRQHLLSFARALQQELRQYLQRRKAKRELRDVAFAAYVLTFDPHTAILNELEQSAWWDYAAALANLFPPRHPGRAGSPPDKDETPDWLTQLLASEDLPKLFEHLLTGTMPAKDKRLLIQAVAAHDVPDGRKMIEAGLDAKDANYPDYLTAFGSFASSDADLQRLTAAANDPAVATAAGAIEGLRQSGLAAADTELRKVLEQGLNLGVKSQALGALLSRASDKSALLEEYLDPNKDAALRAVAVSAVPLSNVERLQKAAEEDASPTVRLAALNRVGSITPKDDTERKVLHAWFLTVKDRDLSALIRATARKYANATADKQ
jgi:hypothetical protein